LLCCGIADPLRFGANLEAVAMYRSSLAAIFFVLNLLGCDNYGSRDLVAGVTTVAEVRQRMGAPVAEWPNGDGSLTLEYPKGPEGKVTLMVTVNERGVFQKVDQVLADAFFAKVKPGMKEPEVRRLLGRPGSIETFDLAKETVWSWLIEPPQPSPERHYFNVHFGLDGSVLRSTRSVTPLR
jgi:hypothetical protein